MDFKEALDEMLKGKKVKRVEWKGYWCWDDDKDTILMYCEDGKVVDIRDSDVYFTLSNISKGGWWQIATEENCKLLKNESNNETFGFDEAIRQLKKGGAVKRLGWNGKEQFITLDHIHNEEYGHNKVFVFHGTLGIQLGWLASQGDMLAEDWICA